MSLRFLASRQPLSLKPLMACTQLRGEQPQRGALTPRRSGESSSSAGTADQENQREARQQNRQGEPRPGPVSPISPPANQSEGLRAQFNGNWKGETQTKRDKWSQIRSFVADFRWFLQILAVPGNYSIAEAQIFAENPQIFTENRWFLQKLVCPIEFVPCNSAPSVFDCTDSVVSAVEVSSWQNLVI